MSAVKLIYTEEELKNAFEFYDVKQMYMCGNHDDNNKSLRHRAWSNDSNLVKSSVEEYYYYLNNYGTVLTFNRDGDIICDFGDVVCDFDCSCLPTGSPKILLRIPEFKYKDSLCPREEEEYRARRERQKKTEHNPEMWKILAIQDSAKLQEHECLREEEDDHYYNNDEPDDDDQRFFAKMLNFK